MDKYQYSEEELAFLESSQVPFAVYQFINKRVVTLALSKGFFEIFGISEYDKKEAYELMDNNMYRDTHPDDISLLGDAAYRFATGESDYDVIYRTRKNGEYRIIHAYGRHIYRDKDVRLAFVWYTDHGPYIDDGKNDKNSMFNLFKEQLSVRSIAVREGHDYLTGLPSMTYFFDLAEEGCKEIRKSGKKPVILFMDFNGMKVFNQKKGLAEGDRLLKAFSEDIIDVFSHENCSRFSADHFCVYTDEETAQKGAKEIIARSNLVDIEKRIPVRIGFYLYEDESISISGACDRAKIACDFGKKNYTPKIYYFDDEMMTNLENMQYVVENIDKAINEGWIKVFYQPLIRSANGRVCAEEALARWEDPKLGFLSPAAFIPALEESNTIYKLDLYVVDCVLQKMKDQAESGLYVVPVSVNLSRSDFYTCDVVEEVRKKVDKAGIQRDLITIEITESTIANDLDYMIEQIGKIQELGFSVWMDDFGSGYSSPLMLQKIPFDLIKIDMLFVKQLEADEKSRIILTELVRMAMSLGIDTVAEGVENKKQADFLKEIGCTLLQGFYFCKPIPLNEIIERYDKGLQIGYENPEESEYYAKLGKVNLYSLSISSKDNVKSNSGEYEKLQKENERLKEEADANRKIAELKHSVSALLSNMPAMTFSKDVNTRVYIACNQAFAEYANKETPEDVVGLTDFEIFDDETAKHFIEDDKKALAMDKPYIFYEDVPDAAGNPRQFQTTKLKFTDDTGRECLLGLCQDVTDAMRIKREYVEKLAEVQSRAQIDSLTGMKNKNAYQEREEIMNRRIMERRQNEFAITVFDVNNLKKINDSLGHKAGDELICRACQVICRTFKRSPVYRIGGDEFVVISQDEDYENIDYLVDVIAKHNEDAIVNGGVVIACGMERFIEGSDECVTEVFKRADQNMYENKKSLKRRDKN